MTIIKNHKTYVIDENRTLSIEKYSEKPFLSWYWRYYVTYDGKQVEFKNGLRSQPNSRRLLSKFRSH